MKHSRLAVVWRLSLTGLALWLAGVAVIDGFGGQDRAQPADVIVVLGAQVRPGGRPGQALTRRTRHAVELYRAGLAPYIICSGGLGAHPPTEAEAACGLAERLGVPPAALVREGQAHSTEENALYTAAIMRARRWETAIIASDGYHLYRAALLFRRAGVAAYPSPAQATAGPMHPLQRFVWVNRELAALAWFWGKTLAGFPATRFPFVDADP
jgi:uncharacterized SAM-binding protein YcdF (DUF218 family)